GCKKRKIKKINARRITRSIKARATFLPINIPSTVTCWHFDVNGFPVLFCTGHTLRRECCECDLLGWPSNVTVPGLHSAEGCRTHETEGGTGWRRNPGVRRPHPANSGLL